MHQFLILGDLHGDLGWCRQVVRSAAKAGIKQIFQVGDAGFSWPGRNKYKTDARVSHLLQEYGMTMVFIVGNHDNHAELELLRAGPDGLAPLRQNVFLLPRGGRTEYAGLTIGGLGGAFSVDRAWRTEGKDWWAQEEVQLQDVEKLVAEGPIDILLAHDVPSFVEMRSELDLSRDDEAQADVSRQLLTRAVMATKPRHIFSGHWHTRKISETDLGYGPVRVDVLHMNGSRWGNAVRVSSDEGPLLQIDGFEIKAT